MMRDQCGFNPFSGSPVRYRHADLSAANALAEALRLVGAPSWALAQSPEKAAFLAVESGGLVDHDGKPFDPERAFEIRIFSRDGELSWRRRGGTGDGVLTLEGGSPAGGDWREDPLPMQPRYRRASSRLIWGALDGARSERRWWRLSSARVRHVFLPPFDGEEPRTGRRAHLKVVEYARLAEEEDGNVVPAGERLAGFGWEEAQA